MGFGIRQDDRRFIIHSRINIRLNLLRDGGDCFRARAIHQPGHEIGAIAPEVEQGACTIQFGVGEPTQELGADADFFGTTVTIVDNFSCTRSYAARLLAYQVVS